MHGSYAWMAVSSAVADVSAAAVSQRAQSIH